MPRSIVALAMLAVIAAPAQAQVPDHLKCYTIKDPLALAGIVDLDSPQFGLEAGCRISRAHLFCVPATKTVVSAMDKKTGMPISPLPVSGPDAGDRVCYKIKCPVSPPPPPPDTVATDQFGTRTLTKFKASWVCAPAVMGTPVPIPTATPTQTSTPFPTSTPPRFVDNGDGTITDNQTGLQWERKTGTYASGSMIECEFNQPQCVADPHNVNNTYIWSSSGTAPDGDAFTSFLDTLNGGASGVGNCASADGTTATGGFAGHCDWRLPTIEELVTIVDESQGNCHGVPFAPCIDPIFGPTANREHYSATTDSTDPEFAWEVRFDSGMVESGFKGEFEEDALRAVRGGR
jgi:hypothetical protein